MFDENSGLVKVFTRHVKNGTFKLEDVPALDNLKEIVTEVLKEIQ